MLALFCTWLLSFSFPPPLRCHFLLCILSFMHKIIQKYWLQSVCYFCWVYAYTRADRFTHLVSWTSNKADWSYGCVFVYFFPFLSLIFVMNSFILCSWHSQYIPFAPKVSDRWCSDFPWIWIIKPLSPVSFYVPCIFLPHTYGVCMCVCVLCTSMSLYIT